MRTRTEDKITSISPAPGTYDADKADSILHTNPKYTFGLKPEDKIKSIAPAPNAYDPSLNDHNPAYTFGLRPEEKINSISPAPNHYRPEDC